MKQKKFGFSRQENISLSRFQSVKFDWQNDYEAESVFQGLLYAAHDYINVQEEITKKEMKNKTGICSFIKQALT